MLSATPGVDHHTVIVMPEEGYGNKPSAGASQYVQRGFTKLLWLTKLNNYLHDGQLRLRVNVLPKVQI